MAQQKQEQDQVQQQSNPLSILDSLYCEEHWEEEEGAERDEDLEQESNNYNNNPKNPSLFPLILLEQDLYWEEDELLSLFSKEDQIPLRNLCIDSSQALTRREALQWMLKVNSHYGFSAITAILAINYFDRFLSSFHLQSEKPWMIQLASVACLSLAAKMEETQVPLLLDLQVEETKYVFEAKTIQKMELLVLSTLQWKMNPVTPLSFIDHIIRRLGLKTYLHWEFLKRCEGLLLSIIADSRFVSYRPSVMAAATMLHVINQVEPFNPIEHQNQLMDVLKINKSKVDDCYKLIQEFTEGSHEHNQGLKRKYPFIPSSPNGVINSSFSFDSSNDSWAVNAFVSSSPKTLFKKSRAQEQQMRLPSMNHVAMEVLSSPR